MYLNMSLATVTTYKKNISSLRDVAAQCIKETLTSCSYADEDRGEVKGPRGRDDEHSDVPTAHTEHQEQSSVCFSFRLRPCNNHDNVYL